MQRQKSASNNHIPQTPPQTRQKCSCFLHRTSSKRSCSAAHSPVSFTASAQARSRAEVVREHSDGDFQDQGRKPASFCTLAQSRI